MGNADAAGSFEYILLRRRIASRPWDSSSRLSFGAERRIVGHVWFGLSFGTERGRADGANRAFLLTSFNWGFNHKAE